MTEPGLPTVFLHIGTPKSGTTYLQQRFVDNHERAAEQGLLWPGPRWGVHGAGAKEVRALKKGRSLAPNGPWMRLAEEARAWSGDRVLISMEWLSSCPPHQVEAAVRAFAPCRVEIVITARDLLRTFVAQWQEMTKNYRTWPWAQFVREMLEEDDDGVAREVFWRQQHLPEIIRRWSTAVPLARIHLVTLPAAGGDPELLWTRFCDVLGIDGTGFSRPAKDNASLGVVSAVLMQRVNVAARRQRLRHPMYKRVVYHALGRGVLAPRRRDEDPIAVDAETDAWLRERAADLVTEVRESGVSVFGDVAELLPGEALRGRDPSDVTDRELLELSIDALITLGVQQQRTIERLRRRLRGRDQGVQASSRRARLARVIRRSRR